MIEWSAWLGIGIGGALGALARVACLGAANLCASRRGLHATAAPPLGLLLANTVGCFAIGLLAGGQSRLPEWLFLALAVGICGSLTTFSTLCAQLIRQLREARGLWTSALHLGLNLVLGYLALWIGVLVGT